MACIVKYFALWHLCIVDSTAMKFHSWYLKKEQQRFFKYMEKTLTHFSLNIPHAHLQ